MTRQPNILWIVTDDQRAGTIAALGNPAILTPNMDELAQRGAAFTRAYIPGGLNPAVCMPSRAMMHTGRGLFDIQGDGERIPTDHRMLGEVLKDRGYHCFGTGKWHNGPDAFTRSFSSGGNIFFGGMWDHWNVPACDYDPTGEYDNQVRFVVDFWTSKTELTQHCDHIRPGVHSSTLVADTTVDFLRGYNDPEPFFAYAAFLAPHDPRVMPEEYLDLYDPEKLPLTGNLCGRHPFSYGVEEIRDERLVGYPRDEALVRSELRDYYAMITHLDYEIGRVIAALKETGQYDNTIIVLCGDNGLAVGQHGLMGKQNVYDHSVHVPLLVSGPGVPENTLIPGAVYLNDIYPSLCDLIGEPTPESVTATSFADLLDDPDLDRGEQLYFAYGNLVRGCQSGDYKLIEYRGTATVTQLFNLAADPDESEDLSKDEGHQEMLTDLRNLFLDRAVEVGDRNDSRTQLFWDAFSY